MNDDESMYEERNTKEYFYEKIPEKIVYENTKKSKYALCPRGCGEDTHRFYESISLACVPIVIKTNTVFDRLYTEFPCLTVDKWEDVTIWGIKKMSSFADYRLRVIGCSNKTFNGKCAP